MRFNVAVIRVYDLAHVDFMFLRDLMELHVLNVWKVCTIRSSNNVNLYLIVNLDSEGAQSHARWLKWAEKMDIWAKSKDFTNYPVIKLTDSDIATIRYNRMMQIPLLLNTPMEHIK